MTRGDRVGDYRLEGVVAVSEAAVQFRAVHCVLPRRALVKLSRRETTGSPAIVLREACILEAIAHPGVAQLYDVGRLADRRAWFASELIDGATLADRFAQPIDPATSIGHIGELADVLALAHRRGVAHCAIAPDRIVFGPRGLCLADWSEARLYDAPLRASPPSPYGAPELARGEAIDDRADMFSLGVIAYRALTGALPSTRGDHIAAQARCPDLPRALTALVDRMLADDRWDRPSSAEVHDELARLGHELPMVAMELRIRKPRWTPTTSYEQPAIAATSAREVELD